MINIARHFGKKIERRRNAVLTKTYIMFYDVNTIVLINRKNFNSFLQHFFRKSFIHFMNIPYLNQSIIISQANL